jgi:hypothetical protein
MFTLSSADGARGALGPVRSGRSHGAWSPSIRALAVPFSRRLRFLLTSRDCTRIVPAVSGRAAQCPVSTACTLGDGSMPRSPTYSFRLPRRSDRELLDALRELALEHEMPASQLLRWILRQVVFLGHHPSRVRARLTVTRRREVEPLPPVPTPATVAPAPASRPLIPEHSPRDELLAVECARERRQRSRRRLKRADLPA